MDKEQIYDAKIGPLMKQIIAICKENSIAMIMDFMIPTTEHEDLTCETVLADETGKVPSLLIGGAQALEFKSYMRSASTNITTTRADGTKTLHTFIG